jgi:hypothetical protein
MCQAVGERLASARIAMGADEETSPLQSPRSSMSLFSEILLFRCTGYGLPSSIFVSLSTMLFVCTSHGALARERQCILL